MPDREIELINDGAISQPISEPQPLSYFQLKKEEINNETARQQLIDQYEELYYLYESNPSEDLAIKLIGLQKEIEFIGVNESEIIDAERGIKHARKHEYIN